MTERKGRAVAWAAVVGGVVAVGAMSAFAVHYKRQRDAAREEEHKKLTPESTRDATEPIVDEDYRLRLDVPAEGWKLMSRDEVSELNHDALAGGFFLVEPGQVAWMQVFCERRTADEDLKTFAGRLTGYANLMTELVPQEPSAVKHHGFEAVEIEARGLHNGREGYVVGLAFRRGEHICSNVAVGVPADRSTRALLGKAVRSMTPLDGPIEDRPPRPLPDARGIGWRRRDGVFESATAGLRIKPEPWCRVDGGYLAHGNQFLTHALVTCRRPDFTIAVLPELDEEEDPAGWLPMLAEHAVSGYELSDERLEITVGDTKLPVVVGSGDGDAVLGSAMHLGEGRFVELTMALPPGERAAVMARLGQVLAGFEPLDDEERKAVAAAVEGEKPTGVTAEGSAYRDGLYVDFDHGLRWRLPPTFQPRLDLDASRTIDGARLWARDDAAHLTVSLRVVAAPGPDFHREVAQAAQADESVVAPTLESPLAWGAAEATVSRLDPDENGRITLWVATAVIEGTGYVVKATTLSSRGEVGARQVREVLGALTFKRPIEAPQGRFGAVHRDFHTGYEIRVPDGLRQTVSTRQGGSSNFLWANGKRFLGVVAMGLGDRDTSLVRGMAVQAMIAQAMKTSGGTLSHDRALIAGHRASHATIAGARSDIDIYDFGYDGMFYVIHASLPQKELDAALASFALVPLTP